MSPRSPAPPATLIETRFLSVADNGGAALALSWRYLWWRNWSVHGTIPVIFLASEIIKPKFAESRDLDDNDASGNPPSTTAANTP